MMGSGGCLATFFQLKGLQRAYQNVDLNVFQTVFYYYVVNFCYFSTNILHQELVEQMISKDSKSRLSAAEFMRKYRGEYKHINIIIFMSVRYLGLLLACTRNSL